MFIHFDKFSRPYGYSLPYVYSRLEYVDRIFPFFDPPPCVDSFYTLSVNGPLNSNKLLDEASKSINCDKEKKVFALKRHTFIAYLKESNLPLFYSHSFWLKNTYKNWCYFYARLYGIYLDLRSVYYTKGTNFKAPGKLASYIFSAPGVKLSLRRGEF